MSKAALMIFQKNAILGTVKTRLASTIGENQALDLYNWMTSHTQQVASEIKVDRFIFYSDFIPEDPPQSLSGFQLEVQHGANLGERMSNAFAFLFEKGYSDLVIIGTDCPDLQSSDLNQAYMALSQNDLVIGPAKDGGYYLLGMRRFYPEIFKNIPWSTSKVLELTLDRADESNLDYGFLKILSDIDTIEDWEKFNSRNKIIHE